MKFKSILSTRSDTMQAAAELARAATDWTPDLAVIFVSPHHQDQFEELLEAIQDATNPRNLIGCTGEGIIGPDREIERAPAVALWLAQIPEVRILPFLIDQEDVEQFTTPEDWRDRVGVDPRDRPGLVVLPDPFSVDAMPCIEGLHGAFPDSPLVGGMVSGAMQPGQNRLFLNGQVLRQGLVGVSLSGAVSMATVTSQGCRPIGRPHVVTKAQENVIFELGGHPAMEVLQETFNHAGPSDQALMQQGLHLGRVVDETLDQFRPGDFLVRNVMGIVENRAIAVSDVIRPGQTTQFHVRDARTAHEEMELLLAKKVAELGAPPAGGLLFTCNGRGTRMFESPDHDVGVVNRTMKDCQVAGFFAQGEIGPVGSKVFVHGFTSTLILFQGGCTGSPSDPAE